MTDFNAHLSIASFAMAGLLIIAITFKIPYQEIMMIAAIIIGYVLAALIFEYIKELK